MIIKLGMVLFLPTVFPWIFLNVYLSIKLRKVKYSMILRISESAPQKFRSRAKLLMESNASWVFASYFTHIWLAYLMIRYAWKIPKSEITEWENNIKIIYNKYYRTYIIAAKLVNISLIGFVILLCSFPFK
jgi:hypothetical protein